MMTKHEKKEYKRKYNEKNKDRIKENNRLYRLANAENLKIQAKEYRKNNSEKVKKYYEQNKDKRSKNVKNWRIKYKNKLKDKSLKKRYNLRLDEYNVLYIQQNGLCAICHKPETKINYISKVPDLLAVDHNHKTGQIRGLLCSRCNRYLGIFEENPEMMNEFNLYLQKYNKGKT